MEKKKKKNLRTSRAACTFQPKYDWSREEAREMYQKAVFSFPVDSIGYQDCLEGMAFLPEHTVDLVIADPPFGLDFDGTSSVYHRKKAHVVEGYREVPARNYAEFTQQWLFQMARCMKPTASAYVFSGWTHLLPVLEAVEKVGLHMLNHLIWKYPFGVFTRKKFVSSHYHLLLLVKNPKTYFFHKVEHYPLDVWEIPRDYHRGKKKNGTKLPSALLQKCLEFSSRPGDVVLDPFMGNGTTAVVAKSLYRHYVGFEINEKMKEILEPALEETEVGQAYRSYKERRTSEKS